jgi:hypothetical protein
VWAELDESPASIVATGTGGAILAYAVVDEFGGEGKYRQLDETGALGWQTGPACGGSGGGPVKAIPDEAGGVWAVSSGVWNGHLLCLTRILSDGSFYGCDLGDFGDGWNQFVSDLAQDGSGGVIAAWDEWRGSASTTGFDIEAQKDNAAGDALWNANGVAVCGAAGDQTGPRIVSDGAGGGIVIWHDNRRGGSSKDIYAQRVAAAGGTVWTMDGVAVYAAPYIRTFDAISDGVGGAIIVWYEWRTGPGEDIFAQRIDGDGNLLWASTGVVVCDETNAQASPRLIEDGLGGAIVAWLDSRTGTNQVYAQRLDANGGALWSEDGIVVSGPGGPCSGLRIVADGAKGAIMAWSDGRGVDLDIYAQHIGADGALKWAAGGAAVCTASGNQDDLRAAADGFYGAVFAWSDYRSGSYYADLYAARISPSGVVTGIGGERDQAPAGGFALHQNYPNPFNPATTIRYSIAERSHVTLVIYNAEGERVRMLVDEVQSPDAAGAAVVWDGKNDLGSEVSSGVYYCKLTAGGSARATKKLVYLK